MNTKSQALIHMEKLANANVREIPNCPSYFVSENGIVFCNKLHFRYRNAEIRQLKPNISSHNYERVSIFDSTGKKIFAFVHRLVCLTFCGDPPLGKPLVLHRDGNSRNNHYTNLYWGNAWENKQDSMRHGTYYQGGRKSSVDGEANPNAKLTSEQVKEIRNLINSGEKIRVIARAYNVYPYTIRCIRDGRSWKETI